MRKMALAATFAAMAVSSAPAFADPPPWAPAHGQRAQRIYDSQGRYLQPRPLSRRDYVWRGRDGRYYCKRDNGTTGLVIGAALGGLLGNQVSGKGDKTLGTIIGAVGGGLLGRAIDRGDLKCR
ncbi:MAG: glycine zipper 2TM domain-containing protein [Novosphingobium sp.]|nr:glycine zipper 2TM domain-containing protein [Novosphingobium sp.]